MPSPPRSPTNVDSEPTGAPSSYALCAYDQSDKMSDVVLLETKLAHDGLAADEHATDGLRVPTITYEEALEREMEYARKVKKMKLHHDGSRSLGTTSQDLPAEPTIVGIKRRLVNGEQSETVKEGTHEPTLPPQELRHQKVPVSNAHQLLIPKQHSLQMLQDRRSIVDQSFDQTPLPQGWSCKQPLAPLKHCAEDRHFIQQKTDVAGPMPHKSLSAQLQTFQELPQGSHYPNLPPQQGLPFRQFPMQLSQRPPLHPMQQQQPPLQLRQPQGQRPPLRPPYNQQPPNYQDNPVWCKLCNVKCVTHYNLRAHCQGKKHKARVFEVSQSKPRPPSSF